MELLYNYFEEPLRNMSYANIISPFIKQHALELATITLLSYTAYKIYKRPKNLPPGPLNWPIQSAIQTPGEWHLDFVRLGQQYGEIFSFYFGSRLVIVLNSHQTIKECFGKRKDFCERPPSASNYFLDLDDEISNQHYSEKWKAQKKFAVQALKTSGFGTSASECKLQSQVDELILYLQGLNGEASDLLEPLRFTTANIIASILVSKSYKWGDAEQLQLIEGTTELLATFSDVHFVDQLAAWLPRWAIAVFFRQTVKTLAKGTDKLSGYVQDRINEHRKDFDSDIMRDFLDIYIRDRCKEKDFTDRKFVCTALTFMPDAIDTTAYVVLWILLYLGYHPEEQLKAQKQIAEICSGGRHPSLSDRDSLTYTEAIIIETLRLVNIFPTTIPHYALEDTTYRSYNIPKTSPVYANLYGIHMDPKVFPQPTTFRPGRFLDEEGKLINTDLVIAFGVGRRMCMGQQLVRMELFLLISNLLQQFKFNFPPNEWKPSLQPDRNVIAVPKKFLISAVPRF